jgi:hypothetical protein
MPDPSTTAALIIALTLALDVAALGLWGLIWGAPR